MEKKSKPKKTNVKSAKSEIIEAIVGSIIITPKEIEAFKNHGIDIAVALKKIQKEMYGKISKHW
jgi:hypothetical protein